MPKAVFVRAVQGAGKLVIRFPIPAAVLYGLLSGYLGMTLFEWLKGVSYPPDLRAFLFVAYGMIGGMAFYTGVIIHKRWAVEPDGEHTAQD